MSKALLSIHFTAMTLFLLGCGGEPESVKEIDHEILEDGRVKVKVEDVGIKFDNKLEDISEKTVNLGQFETFELLMVDHQPLPFFALLTTKEKYERSREQGIKENKALRAAMKEAYGDNKIDVYLPFLSDALIVFLAMQAPSGEYWNPTEHPGPSPLGLPPLEPMTQTEKAERVSALLEALRAEDITFVPAKN